MPKSNIVKRKKKTPKLISIYTHKDTESITFEQFKKKHSFMNDNYDFILKKKYFPSFPLTANEENINYGDVVTVYYFEEEKDELVFNIPL